MAKKEEPWMRMDDDDVLEKCWRCCSGRAHASNAIVFCDFCGYGVHQKCDSAPLGVFVLPGEKDEWVCGFCRHKSSAAKAKWRKILAGDRGPWNLYESQPLQLLNDDGPSSDYRCWVSTILKRNTDFITLFGWFDMFGDVVGTGRLSFADLEAVFACPTSSGLLREVHVQLLTCAGKKPHKDTWFRTLLDFIDDNEEAFSDATKLSKAFTAQKVQASTQAAAAKAQAQDLEDTEDVPLGRAGAGSSAFVEAADPKSSDDSDDVQDKRMWGAEARKAARAARDAALGTHGIIAGKGKGTKGRATGAGGTGMEDEGECSDDSGSEGEGEAGDSRDWNYFALPVLVRVSLLRCLCDELLCIDTKSNKKLADFLRVKVAARDSSGVPEAEIADSEGAPSKGSKGKKEEEEAMAPEQLREAIQPIAQVPLYASLPSSAVSTAEQPPVPDYVQTLVDRARHSEANASDEGSSADSMKPAVPPGRVYHLPGYLAGAALHAGQPVSSSSGLADGRVSLELLQSPRRRESKGAGAVSRAGAASTHASALMAIPRSFLSVQPLPVPSAAQPVDRPYGKRGAPSTGRGRSSRNSRAVIDDDEEEDDSTGQQKTGEIEDGVSDVEEVPDESTSDAEAEDEAEGEEAVDSEEALPDLPPDSEDARAMRYYFFEDSTGAFRLIRMRADLPLECAPGSLQARQHLVIRAKQAAQATVQHERMVKKAAEEARARAEAEEVAARAAAEKAVADAEARRKAFFKVAGLAAPPPSHVAPKAATAASDEVEVIEAAAPVAEASFIGTKRPAGEISSEPAPPAPSASPPAPAPASATLQAPVVPEAKKAKTAAPSKAQPPAGQKTLFQMFSKPKPVQTPDAAPAAAAVPVPTVAVSTPSPSAAGETPSQLPNSRTPVQTSTLPQALLTVSDTASSTASGVSSTMQEATVMKAAVEEVRAPAESPAVPIPEELKQQHPAIDDSDVMLVDSPMGSSAPALPAAPAAAALGAPTLAALPLAEAAAKGGKRKPVAKVPAQPELTIPPLEVLPQLPGLVYTTVSPSAVCGADAGSGALAGLSTVATLADSLPALEGVIAELSRSTSLWERHVAKRLQADALPRARTLAKRSERRGRKHVADLSSWAYGQAQGGASTAAQPHDGAYAGRTRGRRPVNYDVDAALDKLMGVA